MSAGGEVYRVHDELVPSFGPRMWRRICAHPGEQERYLQRVVQYVLATARRRGVVPMHEPVTSVVARGRRIVVMAEVFAVGPVGLPADEEIVPADVVDRGAWGQQ